MEELQRRKQLTHIWLVDIDVRLSNVIFYLA